jgi:hypothetical protein
MLFPFIAIKLVVFEVLSEHVISCAVNSMYFVVFLKTFISAIVILDLHCICSVQI